MDNKESNRNLAILLLIILVVVLFFVSMFNAYLSDDLVDKIRRGDVVLYCIMQEGGERQIDGKEVVDFSEGRYYFVTGSATNCRVIKSSHKE